MEALVCPACNTSLTESGDIIMTQLNPSEQYKSSVLAGLKPEVILDISGRAIAFYEYQVSQELCFQSMLQSNIEDKYNSLREQYNMMNRDFNNILKVEREKQTTLVKEKEMEKRKYQQLYNQLEEKTKQFQKLQNMYEKLKRKTIQPNMQQQQNNLIPTALSVISSATRMGAAYGAQRTGYTSHSNRPTIAGTNTPTTFTPTAPLAAPASARRPSPSVRTSISRIPSPIKSVYSTRSSRYATRNASGFVQPNELDGKTGDEIRHRHYHRHHKYRSLKHE
ncbi:hypothetical protein RMATCC62417_08422 [Rhizopus microsporus]|nr:hypothetical protein RMATCC62417_08422 [Rhizopus microsporus]